MISTIIPENSENTVMHANERESAAQKGIQYYIKKTCSSILHGTYC